MATAYQQIKAGSRLNRRYERALTLLRINTEIRIRERIQSAFAIYLPTINAEKIESILYALFGNPTSILESDQFTHVLMKDFNVRLRRSVTLHLLHFSFFPEITAFYKYINISEFERVFDMEIYFFEEFHTLMLL